VYATVRELIETHPDLADGHAPITMDHPCGRSSWASSTNASTSKPPRC
jgi:hypothetical protein